MIEDGRVRAAAQAPCALWEGVAALADSLAALPDWARAEAQNAVTMTGELCDAFADRRDGVAAIARWAMENLRGPVRIYAGAAGFLAPAEAEGAAAAVASANWHATARLAGRHCPEALLVDIGSTTSDLIPIRGGEPRAQGYCDAERLRTGELVYAGAVRTPLMALGPTIPFCGAETGLMAEHFATSADVYRLLGRLPDEADQQEAADGRGKSIEETETRLARMIGCDRADASPAEWRGLAEAFARLQRRRLARAAERVANSAHLDAGAPVIGCGVGRFLALDLAADLRRGFVDLGDLVAPGTGDSWISFCAPAVAVGLLALRV